jgi:fluoride exporter
MIGVLVWIGVGVLGGVGAIARFLLDALVSAWTGARLPWGTLVVNVSGATLLGLLTGLALHGDALLLAGTAVLGSYTTFSTLALESERLGEDGRSGALAANLLVSLVAGVVAAALGRAVGGAL